MVCKKCESVRFTGHVAYFTDLLTARQKLSKVAAPDPFTSTSSSVKEGSRKIGENKLLTRPGSSKNRFQVWSHSIVLVTLALGIDEFFLAISREMQGL
jgi:hypothetical protein